MLRWCNDECMSGDAVSYQVTNDWVVTICNIQGCEGNNEWVKNDFLLKTSNQFHGTQIFAIKKMALQVKIEVRKIEA